MNEAVRLTSETDQLSSGKVSSSNSRQQRGAAIAPADVLQINVEMCGKSLAFKQLLQQRTWVRVYSCGVRRIVQVYRMQTRRSLRSPTFTASALPLLAAARTTPGGGKLGDMWASETPSMFVAQLQCRGKGLADRRCAAQQPVDNQVVPSDKLCYPVVTTMLSESERTGADRFLRLKARDSRVEDRKCICADAADNQIVYSCRFDMSECQMGTAEPHLANSAQCEQ